MVHDYSYTHKPKAICGSEYSSGNKIKGVTHRCDNVGAVMQPAAHVDSSPSPHRPRAEIKG